MTASLVPARPPPVTMALQFLVRFMRVRSSLITALYGFESQVGRGNVKYFSQTRKSELSVSSTS